MPECLKIGKPTPVFKGGDNILSNYRPIMVVNSIAKVFEKAVNARLTKYLDKFNHGLLNTRPYISHLRGQN